MSRLIWALLGQKSNDMFSHDDYPDHDLEQVDKNNKIRRDGSLKCTQHMGLDKRKSVFGVLDKVRLEQAYSAAETRENIEAMLAAGGSIIIFKEQMTKAPLCSQVWLAVNHNRRINSMFETYCTGK